MMTPERIAAIRAEFEQIWVKAHNLPKSGLKRDSEDRYIDQEPFWAWEFFLLAHTSSEMSKDAAINTAIKEQSNGR